MSPPIKLISRKNGYDFECSWKYTEYLYTADKLINNPEWHALWPQAERIITPHVLWARDSWVICVEDLTDEQRERLLELNSSRFTIEDFNYYVHNVLGV